MNHDYENTSTTTVTWECGGLLPIIIIFIIGFMIGKYLL